MCHHIALSYVFCLLFVCVGVGVCMSAGVEVWLRAEQDVHSSEIKTVL